MPARRGPHSKLCNIRADTDNEEDGKKAREHVLEAPKKIAVEELEREDTKEDEVRKYTYPFADTSPSETLFKI